MPFAGNRAYNNASISGQGTTGGYWSSSPLPSSSRNVYFLVFTSNYVNPQNNSFRAGGLSVRSFKDSYVAPDSTWTVVQ